MRLRVDLMDDPAPQAKLRQDLQAMETLVREGLAYARTLHATDETAILADPDALLDTRTTRLQIAPYPPKRATATYSIKIARKSFTLVRVGPQITESPKAWKKP